MLVREEHRRHYLNSVRRVLRPGGVFFIFNRVASRDIKIADEEAYIMRHLTTVEQKHQIDSDGTYVKVRWCGFRSASMRQYRQEIEAAGFEVVRERDGSRAHPPMGMLLARVS